MKINYDSKKLSSLQPSELHHLASKLEKAIALIDHEYYKKRSKNLIDAKQAWQIKSKL
tara:strand:+ start:231 stop:404 length:174 start_codon:yes stop_codon:yes gene_type:complete